MRKNKIILIVFVLLFISGCHTATADPSLSPTPTPVMTPTPIPTPSATPAPATTPQPSPTPNPTPIDENQYAAVKSQIMSSDRIELTDEDFQITYQNVVISKDTDVEDITSKLGFPEDYYWNNDGFISGNEMYRRWNLCYPDYYDDPQDTEIRIIIISERDYIGEEVKDGYSYTVGIYLENYRTSRGLEVGDGLEKVLQAYGRPDSFDKNDYSMYFLRYSKDNVNLDITLEEDMQTVRSIFLDFNMQKSMEDQFGKDYVE